MFLARFIPDRTLNILTYVFILVFSMMPLFLTLPYRVNIYVTWEGAYRMWLGQIPYQDFGMPIGYGFWIIPYLSFLIFGPFMVSLIKAQVVINLISLILLKKIFNLFDLNKAATLLSLVAFCLTFVIINFWPWYNHTVFFFELVALYFALRVILGNAKLYNLTISTFFIWLAILTKQDGGGLTLMLVGSLVLIDTAFHKKWLPILVFCSSFVLLFFLFIVPFLSYEFSYWFNYGQEPHYSRISAYDFVNDIFFNSHWIKGYLFIIFLVLASTIKDLKEWFKDKTSFFFAMVTFGILVQATLIQVTSFSPPTVNFYFHTFAISFLLYLFQNKVKYQQIGMFSVILCILVFWNSENVWKYTQKIFAKVIPSVFSPPPSNVVSKGNWAALDSTSSYQPVIWINSDIKSLKGMKLPENTENGAKNIIDLGSSYKNPKVLNMSNLTSLAYDMQYEPLSNERFPLWYHKEVALFDREIDMLCSKIDEGQFDIILFEDMPNVNNFFPYAVRDCALNSNYKLIDKFLSPTGYTSDSVEVFIKRTMDFE